MKSTELPAMSAWNVGLQHSIIYLTVTLMVNGQLLQPISAVGTGNSGSSLVPCDLLTYRTIGANDVFEYRPCKNICPPTRTSAEYVNFCKNMCPEYFDRCQAPSAGHLTGDWSSNSWNAPVTLKTFAITVVVMSLVLVAVIVVTAFCIKICVKDIVYKDRNGIEFQSFHQPLMVENSESEANAATALHPGRKQSRALNDESLGLASYDTSNVQLSETCVQ
jgi:hypothetical protein